MGLFNIFGEGTFQTEGGKLFTTLRGSEFERRKIDRVLEERSHLAIEFPQSDNRVFRTYIPFLENPKITEAGASILQEYQLLGKAGTIFSYGGAESRAFNIVFNINLMHMLHMESLEGIADKFRRGFQLFWSGKEQSKERFKLIKDSYAFKGKLPRQKSKDKMQGMIDDNLSKGAGGGKETIKWTPNGFPHAKTHRDFYQSAINQLLPTGNNAWDYGNWTDLFKSGGKDDKRIDKLIDLVYVWVNLIRGTILNNSTDTTQGPPIVRLTHGPMYNNVPCIVHDYDIKIMDEVGFEIQTLTPKKIEIQLSLSELRTPNGGSFEEGKVLNGDNLAGWEAIIGNNNIDPYNGAINSDRDYLLQGRPLPGQ